MTDKTEINKHEIDRIAEALKCFVDIMPIELRVDNDEGTSLLMAETKDALLKKLQDIVCPDYAKLKALLVKNNQLAVDMSAENLKLQAKVQEMESWKPDEDSYLCGYQQAVLNSTGIIVSPNEGAGSFSRWLQRLSQRTSPPTENHYAEKLVNLNRQIESLQSELSALKAENEKLKEFERKRWESAVGTLGITPPKPEETK